MNVNCSAFTLGPDASTTCKLRLCGLPMPTMPIARRSLADAFLPASFVSAASSCRAYQAGSPAAASAASERCIKPRRDKLPLSIFVSSRAEWVKLKGSS